MGRKITIPALLLIFAMVWGCGTSQRQIALDKNWGRSNETARFSQILNPDASEDNNPVTGLDGEAARNSLVKYQNSFKSEESTGTVMNINLTGVGTK